MSWRMGKLSDVLKQYRNTIWIDDSQTYRQVSILNNGSVIQRGERIGKEIGRKRQFVIDLKKYPNTLIFTRQLLLQGSIGIAPSDVDGCIVTENMPMFSVEGINHDYLNCFIKSQHFKKQVEQLTPVGSAQKALHEREFLKIEIPLPPDNEQKKIVQQLRSQIELTEKLSKSTSHQKNLLTELRQAIL